jgi:hypothetical protein
MNGILVGANSAVIKLLPELDDGFVAGLSPVRIGATYLIRTHYFRTRSFLLVSQ